MKPDSVGPLSRPQDVSNVPPQGIQVHVAATAEECARVLRRAGASWIGVLTLARAVRTGS